jgi:hypothetical protein
VRKDSKNEAKRKKQCTSHRKIANEQQKNVVSSLEEIFLTAKQQGKKLGMPKAKNLACHPKRLGTPVLGYPN